jgi:homoprotocatechuate degradation regulator HpaR
MPKLARPNLPMLLLVARERVIGRFRPVLNEHGLTEQQWRVLRAVHDAGTLEPRELVGRCGISSPSLAGVLARMETLGLVERRRFDHDQRRIAVALTATGERLVATLAPRIEAIYREIEGRIGADVVARRVRDLDLVTASLAADRSIGRRAAPTGRGRTRAVEPVLPAAPAPGLVSER